MKCANCKKRTPKNSKFCQHCGIKISHTSNSNRTRTEAKFSHTKPIKMNLKQKKIASWIIGSLLIVILALCFWLANFYRQDIRHMQFIVQSFIEPSRDVNESNWNYIDDPHGRFSAYFPVSSEVEKYTFVMQGESIPGFLYTGTINKDDSVEIAYMNDPNILYDSDAKASLDRLVEGFLINNNGLIIDGDYSTFLNYRSFEYRASVDNNSTYVKSLIFINNHDVYMLNEYDKSGKFSSFEKFRNHFELN